MLTSSSLLSKGEMLPMFCSLFVKRTYLTSVVVTITTIVAATLVTVATTTITTSISAMITT